MYTYSTSHGEKIFHAASCTYSGRIKMKNRNYFDTKQEAREHGYRMCNCCAPIVRYMKRERNEIERFARKHNMKLHVYDGELHVEFGVVPWEIVVRMRPGKSFCTMAIASATTLWSGSMGCCSIIITGRMMSAKVQF